MRRAGAFVAAALLAAGCSVSAGNAQFIGPVNTCDTSSACGGDAACVDGRCVATTFDLEGLLVEVRPHANATFGATTSYIFDPASADIPLRSDGSSAPFVARMSPTLPPFVAIRGGRVRVHEKTALGANCALGEDRSIPAKVTFHRVAPFAGLPLSPITATTNDQGQLDVDLVPDVYDVYVEPQAVAVCNDGLPFPPVYLPGQLITTGGALTWDLPVVGTLTGTVSGFGDVVPEGWKLDLLEPTRGLPVSANATLKKVDPNVYELKAQIARPDSVVPVVRLAPPATTADENAQPSAYWTLDGAVSGGTQTDPVIHLIVEQLFGKPVQVGGNVYGSDGFTRVRATLAVQSTSLSGPAAKNASFAIDGITTGEHGEFSFFLPPGTYTIRVTPVDNGLRITDFEDFTVAPDAECFCGQSLRLASKTSLSGVVKTPVGERVAGATLSIYPAQLAARSYWNTTHELAPLAPRVASTLTGNDGNFHGLLVDVGSAEIVVETAPAAGFPWAVRPRVDVEGSVEEAVAKKVTLGPLIISNPAILAGTVRDPNGLPVANAEVNAWLPVRDPSAADGLACTVVKIATTSTDADGNYTLLMPASL